MNDEHREPSVELPQRVASAPTDASQSADTLPLAEGTRRGSRGSDPGASDPGGGDSRGSEPTGHEPTLPPSIGHGGEPQAAATRVEASLIDASFVPTRHPGDEIDQTLDFVRSEVKRKAAAVLHTTVGDYEIERELGRGGMGVVYKARHRQLRRDVALKMILSGKHAGPEQLERFLVEARAVARLQHPHIVQIFDIGEHDGLPYFSLEFVDGQSLQQFLDRQPQPADEAARLIEQLARAMQYAHDHGVLHRDLKPANVLLTSEGSPKISDFGLAKKVDDDESASTRTGTVMGTPSYMSPEQAQGRTHEVGPAADQYSLAAMLYEMLTGRPPFLAARAVDTILQVIQDEPIRPRQLQPTTPADIETICLKALHKDPEKRYASCRELADDLRRFLNGEPIVARPVGQLERCWRWCQRNPRVAIPSALAVALLVAAVGILTWSSITVSRQNIAIKRERDNAKRQEELANRNAESARRAQRDAEAARSKADESSRIASSQRGLAVDTLYKVVTKVDEKLKDRADMSDLRRELMADALQGLQRVEDSDETKSLVDRSMGVAHQRLADIFHQMGRTEDSAQQHRQALSIFEKLMASHPEDDWARWDAALSYEQLGNFARTAQNDVAAALELYRKALRLREELHASLHIQDPDLTPAKVEQALINSYARLGSMAMLSGDAATARDYFLKTLQRSERLVAADPKSTAARQALAGSYSILGKLSFRLRDASAAEKYFSQALTYHQALAEESPHSLKANLDVAADLSQQGDLQLQLLQRPADAAAAYEKSLAIGQRLLAGGANDAPVRSMLADAHHRLGTALWLLDRRDEARQHFQAATRFRRVLCADDPNNPSKLLSLMQSVARAGEHGEAFELGQSLLPRLRQDHQSLYGLVCGFCICADVVPTSSAAAASSDEETARARYTDAAISALELAVQLGFNSVMSLETDPDLATLRDDPRCAAIIATLKARSKSP